MRRRTYLRTVGAAAATAGLAGCAGDGDGTTPTGSGGTEVVAGPDGSNIFEPKTLTVSTGDTVTWTFDSPGHNVECDPEQSDYATLPEGADPFASYEGSNRFTFVADGETYEYTFEVAGSYEYICVPHAPQGMIGTIEVEE